MAELLTGLMVGSLVGGVIPVVNAEVMVVVATLAATSAGAPAVVAVATIGQMIAKTGLFLTARWAPARLPRRARVALDRGAAAIEGREGAVNSLMLVSAVVGLPPFMGVSVAAGALRVSWQSFVVIGSIGRALRFSGVAWAAVKFGEVALEMIG